MPSVQYFNRTAPFWDFVASLEEQGSDHPFAGANNNRGRTSDNENERSNPWTEGWAGWPWGAMPHRSRHGPPHHEGPGGPPPPPPQHDDDGEAGPSEPKGPPPPFSDSEEGPRYGRHGQHGRHGRHGGFGGRGGKWGCGRGWGSRGGCQARFGGMGPFGGGVGPFSGMGPVGPFAEMFRNQLFGEDTEKNEDFQPEADVFDTPETFVVHISLPGANKEDVGVNWDADKSELNVAGVIYRPGDEDFLKTLALDERKIGAFERKIRLGSRANPAQVDVDGITAKMEDGVLRVEVPKLDSGYVDVKKVDLE